jgi:site-specific recombinase XerD
MEQYRGRGLSEQTVLYTESRLDRWGLKKRRPRAVIEGIDAETITPYIEACASFRSKATAYGTLSTIRGFGDYLVYQGLW